MEYQHGFRITRVSPGSDEWDDIVVDITVYASHDTDRAKVVALLEEAVGQAGESVVWTWAEEEVSDGAGDSGIGPGTTDA